MNKRCARLLGALVVLLTAVGLGGAPPASAEAGEPESDRRRIAAPGETFARTTSAYFRDIVVDPSTGDVYVASGDSVLLFDSDGYLIDEVANVYGAGGIAVDDYTLWVTMTSAGALAEIDIASRQVIDTHPLGTTIGDTIVVMGDAIWVPGGAGNYKSLYRFDKATDTFDDRGGSVYGGRVVAIPESGTHLLFHDTGLSPFSVYKVNLTTNPVTVEGDVPHGVGSNLKEVAPTDHGTFVTASGSPYRFPQFSLATMEADGVIYDASHYPTSIAWTAQHGGMFAGGTDSTEAVWVYRDGAPTLFAKVVADGRLIDRSVEFSADGRLVYYVYEGVSDGLLRFGVLPLPLQPEVDSLDPVKGSGLGGTVVSVYGASLATTTEVWFGDLPADDFVVVGDGEVWALSPRVGYAGSVPVTVVTEYGETTATGAPQFTYTDSPAQYVERLFRDFLARDATAKEIADRLPFLGSRSNHKAMARELGYSTEWVGRVVDEFYLNTLGRKADANGKRVWSAEIISGRMTTAEVAARFYASKEYFQAVGNDLDAWIDDLYRELLHREPDASGRANWKRHAQANGRLAVAVPFYRARETRIARVEALYQKLLGRGADASGLEHWIGVLLRTGNDVDLAVELGSSAEYFQKAVSAP